MTETEIEINKAELWEWAREWMLWTYDYIDNKFVNRFVGKYETTPSSVWQFEILMEDEFIDYVKEGGI